MVDVRGYPLSGSLDAKKVQMLLVVFSHWHRPGMTAFQPNADFPVFIHIHLNSSFRSFTSLGKPY